MTSTDERVQALEQRRASLESELAGLQDATEGEVDRGLEGEAERHFPTEAGATERRRPPSILAVRIEELASRLHRESDVEALVTKRLKEHEDGESKEGGGDEGDPPLKDDPKYKKYFEMIKLGLPKAAAKHAMNRDQLDPSILDLDPMKSLKSQVKPKEGGGGNDDPLLKDDPKYKKYFRMTKVGIPKAAAKNAMIRDQLDPSILDLDPEKSLNGQRPKYLLHRDLVIGKGSNGQVQVCIARGEAEGYHSKKSGKRKKFACKCVMLRNDPKYIAKLQEEVNALRELQGHDNVIRLFDVFCVDNELFIITELGRGGDLLQLLTEHPKHGVTEAYAAKTVAEMLSAVSFLHSRHICHRDLKLENWVLTSGKNVWSPLKLIDFGHSTHYDPGHRLSRVLGSSYYVAPEVLKKSYTEACDLWSLGVIVYMLLSGAPPFYGENDDAIMASILHGEYQFPHELFQDVSGDAMAFVSCMLSYSIEYRYTAEQALTHPWLKANCDPDQLKRAKDGAGAGEGYPPLKDNSKYKKYFKMIKLSILKAAVKHAMNRDQFGHEGINSWWDHELDPSILDLDPEKSLKSHGKSKKGSEGDVDPPLKDDPKYKKYFRMIKVGIPKAAVKNAMIRNQLGPRILDLDLVKTLNCQRKPREGDMGGNNAYPLEKYGSGLRDLSIPDTLPKYRIGKKGKAADMVVNGKKETSAAVAKLQAGDAAFVRDVDGAWAYAIVRNRIEGAIIFWVAPDYIRGVNFYAQRCNPHLVIPMCQWGTHVRRIKHQWHAPPVSSVVQVDPASMNRSTEDDNSLVSEPTLDPELVGTAFPSRGSCLSPTTQRPSDSTEAKKALFAEASAGPNHTGPSCEDKVKQVRAFLPGSEAYYRSPDSSIFKVLILADHSDKIPTDYNVAFADGTGDRYVESLRLATLEELSPAELRLLMKTEEASMEDLIARLVKLNLARGAPTKPQSSSIHSNDDSYPAANNGAGSVPAPSCASLRDEDLGDKNIFNEDRMETSRDMPTAGDGLSDDQSVASNRQEHYDLTMLTDIMEEEEDEKGGEVQNNTVNRNDERTQTGLQRPAAVSSHGTKEAFRSNLDLKLAQGEIRRLNTLLGEAQSEIRCLGQALSNALDKLSVKDTDLNLEVAKGRMRELEKSLAQQKILSLEGDLSDAQDALEDAQGVLGAVFKENDDARGKIRGLEEDLAESVDALRYAMATNEILREQKREVERTAAELETVRLSSSSMPQVDAVAVDHTVCFGVQVPNEEPQVPLQTELCQSKSRDQPSMSEQTDNHVLKIQHGHRSEDPPVSHLLDDTKPTPVLKVGDKFHYAPWGGVCLVSFKNDVLFVTLQGRPTISTCTWNCKTPANTAKFLSGETVTIYWDNVAELKATLTEAGNIRVVHGDTPYYFEKVGGQQKIEQSSVSGFEVEESESTSSWDKLDEYRCDSLE